MSGERTGGAARNLAYLRDNWPLAAVMVFYILIVAFVNPLREMPLYDDWAYAWSVERLIRTGQYVQHDWITANAPAHIYWGALFARIFGMSFATLRLSTLALIGAMLAAFYGLAREIGFGPRVAGLLALMLLGSPLVLTFGFTYMTDLPFTALAVIALALLTRAIRRGSWPWMVAGGIAAGAAALIRQVGVAFVPALGLIWWLNEQRSERLPFYAVGMLPALAATAWQTYAGVAEPSWISAWVSRAQAAYLAQTGGVIVETLWRLMAVMQYLVLFCIPLATLAILDYGQVLKNSQRLGAETTRREAWIMAGLGGYLIGMTVIGSFALHKPGLMPVMQWSFWYMASWPPALLAGLTVFSLAGGFCFARLIVLRAKEWRRLPLHERLIDLTGLLVLAINIMFFVYGDRYLIPLVPCVLLAFGGALRPWLERFFIPASAFGLALLIIFANGERADLASQEAAARAGDALLAQGVPAEAIYNNWAWDSAHGAFDHFKAEIGSQDVSILGGYFDQWLPSRWNTAQYVVSALAQEPDARQWKVVLRIPYSGLFGETETMAALKRVNTSLQSR